MEPGAEADRGAAATATDRNAHSSVPAGPAAPEVPGAEVTGIRLAMAQDRPDFGVWSACQDQGAPTGGTQEHGSSRGAEGRRSERIPRPQRFPRNYRRHRSDTHPRPRAPQEFAAPRRQPHGHDAETEQRAASVSARTSRRHCASIHTSSSRLPFDSVSKPLRRLPVRPGNINGQACNEFGAAAYGVAGKSRRSAHPAKAPQGCDSAKNAPVGRTADAIDVGTAAFSHFRVPACGIVRVGTGRQLSENDRP
jgi:hypothetical protein